MESPPEETLPRSLDMIARDLHRRIAALDQDVWSRYVEIGRCLAEARTHFGEDDSRFGLWCKEQNIPYDRDTRHKLQRIATDEAGLRSYLSGRPDGARPPGIKVVYDFLFGHGRDDDQDEGPPPEMALDVHGADGRVGKIEATPQELRILGPDGSKQTYTPSDKETRRQLSSTVGKRDEATVRQVVNGLTTAEASRLAYLIGEVLAYDLADLVWRLPPDAANRLRDRMRQLPDWWNEAAHQLGGLTPRPRPIDEPIRRRAIPVANGQARIPWNRTPPPNDGGHGPHRAPEAAPANDAPSASPPAESGVRPDPAPVSDYPTPEPLLAYRIVYADGDGADLREQLGRGATGRRGGGDGNIVTGIVATGMARVPEVSVGPRPNEIVVAVAPSGEPVRPSLTTTRSSSTLPLSIASSIKGFHEWSSQTRSKKTGSAKWPTDRG